MTLRLLGTAGLTVLFACGPASVVFEVKTDRTAPGETLQYALHNAGLSPAGYNLCLARVEALSERGWALVASETIWVTRDSNGIEMACPAMLLSLGAAQTANASRPLAPDATPGTYRLVTHVSDSSGPGSSDVVSNAFVVETN